MHVLSRTRQTVAVMAREEVKYGFSRHYGRVAREQLRLSPWAIEMTSWRLRVFLLFYSRICSSSETFSLFSHRIIDTHEGGFSEGANPIILCVGGKEMTSCTAIILILLPFSQNCLMNLSAYEGCDNCVKVQEPKQTPTKKV